MKHITMSIVMLAVLLFIAPLTSAEDAPSMYFEPVNGSCDCREENTVDLMVNTSGTEAVMQAYIYFDPQCVNITGVDYTGSPWQPIAPPGWKNMGSYVTSGAWNTSGIDPGVYKYVTLTVECVGCECTSPLEITDTITDNLVIYNGTFTCNKTADDPKDDLCLGDCFEDRNCTYLVASNVTCYDCIGIMGQSWVNYPCPISVCNCTCDSMCWSECPQCCDGIDNDGDGVADWPADPKCACCIDGNETVDDGCSVPCVPEMPTIILAGLGLGGLLAIVCIGSIRKKMK